MECLLSYDFLHGAKHKTSKCYSMRRSQMLSINTLGEHALSGHEPIEALDLYIEELENTKAEGLEISYVDIRIRMARALSQAIRNTEESETPNKERFEQG